MKNFVGSFKPNGAKRQVVSVVRLEEILDAIVKYNPKADLDLVKKAYVFSAKVHRGQTRRSGEPFLNHPLAVTKILTQMHLDVQSIVTGLLHDVVEDTLVTAEELRELFGNTISNLVGGVTKLGKIKFSTSEEKQAENFRKMFMAMAEDIRVILVKLADRLHNMRTLGYLSGSKQVEIAQETLDIYAPIAGRLGIQELRSELEDLCFYFLKPDLWDQVNEKVKEIRRRSGRFINETMEILQKRLKEHNISADVSGRIKHYYSTYRKMEEQNLEFDQVYDIIAFRVMLETIPQCYEVLGIIHSLWKPVPGRFKDYIGMPKINRYQSLHTTVIGPEGHRAEFQIRTREMHEVAEWGIASHWKYKEGGEIDFKDEAKYRWIRHILDWQKEVSDPAEYLDAVRLDLFTSDVYAFTPKGRLIEFPSGSTPVDFAYAVHTDVGHQCVGARVNGKLVPLRYAMRSGDTVEIITSKAHKPSKDWLKFVKTPRAKVKIRQYIRNEQLERSATVGRELFEREIGRLGKDAAKVLKSSEFEKFVGKEGYKGAKHLLALVGYGKVSSHQIVSSLFPGEKVQPSAKKEGIISRIFKRAFEKSKGLVMVDGFSDILVTFGKCCNPVPGDSIIGFVTRGRGVTVHTMNCAKVLATDPARRVGVKWNLKAEGTVNARVRVVCVDKPGLLAEISQSISDMQVNISHASCRAVGDQKAFNVFDVKVRDLQELHRLIRSIEKIKGVISVERVRE